MLHTVLCCAACQNNALVRDVLQSHRHFLLWNGIELQRKICCFSAHLSILAVQLSKALRCCRLCCNCKHTELVWLERVLQNHMHFYLCSHVSWQRSCGQSLVQPQAQLLLLRCLRLSCVSQCFQSPLAAVLLIHQHHCPHEEHTTPWLKEHPTL